MEVLLVSAALHEISETVDGGRGGGGEGLEAKL